MDMNSVKRQAAIWLLRKLPIADRREVIMGGIGDLNHVRRREFIEGFIPVGSHCQRNPRRKAPPMVK